MLEPGAVVVHRSVDQRREEEAPHTKVLLSFVQFMILYITIIQVALGIVKTIYAGLFHHLNMITVSAGMVFIKAASSQVIRRSWVGLQCTWKRSLLCTATARVRPSLLLRSIQFNPTSHISVYPVLSSWYHVRAVPFGPWHGPRVMVIGATMVLATVSIVLVTRKVRKVCHTHLDSVKDRQIQLRRSIERYRLYDAFGVAHADYMAKYERMSEILGGGGTVRATMRSTWGATLLLQRRARAVERSRVTFEALAYCLSRAARTVAGAPPSAVRKIRKMMVEAKSLLAEGSLPWCSEWMGHMAPTDAELADFLDRQENMKDYRVSTLRFSGTSVSWGGDTDNGNHMPWLGNTTAVSVSLMISHFRLQTLRKACRD